MSGIKKTIVVLVPLRENRPLRDYLLIDDAAARTKKNGGTNDDDREIIGRSELLQTLRKACGCAAASSTEIGNNGNASSTRAKVCSECQSVRNWARLYLPRLFFQIYQDRENSGACGCSEEGERWLLRVSRKSKFPLRCFRLCRKPLPKSENDNESKDWIGPFPLNTGDVLSWYSPKEPSSPPLEFQFLRFEIPNSVSKGGNNSDVISAVVCNKEDNNNSSSNTTVLTKRKEIGFTQQQGRKSAPREQNISLEQNGYPAMSSAKPKRRRRQKMQLGYARALAGLDSDATTTTASQDRSLSRKQANEFIDKPTIIQTNEPTNDIEDGEKGGEPMTSTVRTCCDSAKETITAIQPALAFTCSGKCEKDGGNMGTTLSVETDPIKIQRGITAIKSDASWEKQTSVSKDSRDCRLVETSGECGIRQSISRVDENKESKTKTIRPQKSSLMLAVTRNTENTENISHNDNSVNVSRKISALPATGYDSLDVEHQQHRHDGRFVLYFVEKGIDMHRTLLEGNDDIEGLKKHTLKRGASVLDNFDKEHPPWPTHLVISETVSANVVAQALGFGDNTEQLSYFLGDHNIVCAKRKWAARGDGADKPPFKEPTMIEKFLDIFPKKTITNEKTHLGQNGSVSSNNNKKERVDCCVGRRQTLLVQQNLALVQEFRKLSKLHQKSPLLGIEDEWRAYHFNLISSRLKHLDFDVLSFKDSADAVLERLRKISGFGGSTIKMIEEYLLTGGIKRVREFETDPKRIACRVMMNIWGVGRVRASQLVQAGYETIKQVKDGIRSGKLAFDRNQLIGLECYDEFLETMSREEVESIGAIISLAFKERFPSAVLTIMGSYRRGKQSCGDVDILITHPDFDKAIPSRTLGQFVDQLLKQGHIAHHLTFLPGMKRELFETFPSPAGKSMKPIKMNNNKEGCSSYMGVFFSPLIKGKRRRVDVKFYPYRERIFAALYFTGNGHFNRSMRLWARRKFNYSLSDHGLFERDTSTRVMEASSEIEVFDALGLVWKETSERDGFDSVVSKKDGFMASQLDDISRSDFGKEAQHVWVN